MTSPSAEDLHILLREFAGSDATSVARGLISPQPTPHTVHLAGGGAVHTWCALDTLLLAHLLGADATIHSRPPHPAGSPVAKIRVTDGRVIADHPWILSFPHTRASDGSHFTQAFCPYANLFTSLDEYTAWALAQPRPTTPVSLERADEIARSYSADVRRRAPHPAVGMRRSSQESMAASVATA